jgi:hypothetical protein
MQQTEIRIETVSHASPSDAAMEPVRRLSGREGRISRSPGCRGDPRVLHAADLFALDYG